MNFEFQISDFGFSANETKTALSCRRQLRLESRVRHEIQNPKSEIRNPKFL